jgi:hypothetical protein
MTTNHMKMEQPQLVTHASDSGHCNQVIMNQPFIYLVIMSGSLHLFLMLLGPVNLVFIKVGGRQLMGYFKIKEHPPCNLSFTTVSVILFFASCPMHVWSGLHTEICTSLFLLCLAHAGTDWWSMTLWTGGLLCILLYHTILLRHTKTIP